MSILAVKIVNALSERKFGEIADLNPGDGSASIILDGNKMVVSIDIPFEDYESSEIEGTLDLDEIPEGLSKAGITNLTMSYSGSGDSGGFDNLQLFKGETEIQSGTLDHEIFLKIENYIYQRCYANFDNEGSSGEAHIFLKENLYHFLIEHKDFFTKSHAIEEEF